MELHTFKIPFALLHGGSLSQELTAFLPFLICLRDLSWEWLTGNRFVQNEWNFCRLVMVLRVRALLRYNMSTAWKIKKKLKPNCLKFLMLKKRKCAVSERNSLEMEMNWLGIIFSFENGLSIVNPANFSAILLYLCEFSQDVANKDNLKCDILFLAFTKIGCLKLGIPW